MEEVQSSLACGSDSEIICKVGTLTFSSCSDKTFTKKNELFIIKEKLDDDQLELLIWRTGFDEYNQEDTICSHHLFYYFNRFEGIQKSCCDPYRKHLKPVTSKKNLRRITLQKAKYIKENNNITLIPGKLLCSNCRKMLSKGNEATNYQQDTESSEDIDCDIEFASSIAEKDILNESLIGIDVSPIKLQSVSSRSKPSYIKRKLKQADTQIKKKLSAVLKVTQEQNSDSESDIEKERHEEMKRKCNDIDKLVELMKVKLNTNLSTREKIQVLTIAPQSWSRKRVASEFNVSEYMARKARDLTFKEGILASPGKKAGHKISEEVIKTITLFFEDDEYSMMMPGAKDKVSVRRKEYKQKRLLLCNLKELYVAFKNIYPEVKIGFSTFCALRPKWCVLAGSPGTHSVCVCVFHQNVYLLTNALNLHHRDAAHELMDKVVCSRENRGCMLRYCSNCPSTEALTHYLKEELLKDYDTDDEIQFSQWINDGRIKLQAMTLPVHEFIELVTEKIEKLIPHSFISKTQNSYLKNRKQNLSPNECLILMDFAENYSFVLQNEVQSYHWSHSSCSLHPTVIFTKTSDGSLQETPICFISDDLNHDVPFVYLVQKNATEYIKSNFPYINKIEYFTDGCSGQYKNYKSMMNLCHHKEDFQLDACWSFHATSHGKTVCDGIGGTVKRTVTKWNLQKVHQSSQITDAHQMYLFCCSLSSKISFAFLSREEIEIYRNKLEERFSRGQTITGTRSFHFFSPLSTSEILAKRTSLDKEACIKWNIIQGAECAKELKFIAPSVHSYIACAYENNWWVGMVSKFNEEEGDYTVVFMHPHGPSEKFYWPDRQDVCPVPPQHILCSIETPVATSITARFYKISKTCKDNINKSWDIYNC